MSGTALRVEPYELPTRQEMPERGFPWRVRPRRAVLLVHDMQSYFLAAFEEEMRARLVGTVAGLRKRCADQGVRVAYTAQPGRMSPEDRGLLRDVWGPGMSDSEEDRGIVPELEPDSADWTFVKWRYSAFFRSDLLDRMRAEGRDQLVLCGVYAHVGIVATALEAFSHDIEVFLAGDAVGDFSAEHHRLALRYTASTCALVAPADELPG